MRSLRFAIGMLILTGASLSSCGKPAPPPAVEVVAVRRERLPAGVEDGVWVETPTFKAALLMQDVVEPRLLETSTAEVRVQAVSDGKQIAFRLAWEDATTNEAGAVARFPDACAVQLPQSVGPDLPDPQMGEPAKPVEISYWRASWQTVGKQGGASIHDFYPNAAIDHYPFEAASLTPDSAEQREMETRYAPAKAVGNVMAGPRDRPVQDLVAAGPGSLSPSSETKSDGGGHRTESGWEVMIHRPLPVGMKPGDRSAAAFAVWQGANKETGARKMRSGWIPLALEQ